MTKPPATVLKGFGARSPAVRLDGGQGGTFRAGGIVLKPAGFEPEAELTADLFSRLEGPGFRVPRPVRAGDGRYVHGGWSAWEYVDARDAGRNGGRWPETIAACRAFHAALEGESPGPWQAVLARRTDPWAAADRIAFGEVATEALLPIRAHIARLAAIPAPPARPSQLVHGDFTANVLFADGQPPCVIDFSPYWRPAEFALGVVVADAIAWGGAGEDILQLCADVPKFPLWLARATLRRAWELDQHARSGRESSLSDIKGYLPVIDLIETLAPRRR